MVDSIWRKTFAIAYVLIDQSRNLIGAVAAELQGHADNHLCEQLFHGFLQPAYFDIAIFEKQMFKKHTVISFPCLNLCKSRWAAVRQRIDMKTLAF